MTDSAFNPGGTDEQEADREPAGALASGPVDESAATGAGDGAGHAVRAVIAPSFRDALRSYLRWALVLVLGLAVMIGAVFFVADREIADSNRRDYGVHVDDETLAAFLVADYSPDLLADVARVGAVREEIVVAARRDEAALALRPIGDTAGGFRFSPDTQQVLDDRVALGQVEPVGRVQILPASGIGEPSSGGPPQPNPAGPPPFGPNGAPAETATPTATSIAVSAVATAGAGTPTATTAASTSTLPLPTSTGAATETAAPPTSTPNMEEPTSSPAPVPVSPSETAGPSPTTQPTTPTASPTSEPIGPTSTPIPPGSTNTPAPSNTPVPTSTPVSTSTPVPTSTFGATSTPVPTSTFGATSTPIPFVTPAPTNTPVPTTTVGATSTPAPGSSPTITPTPTATLNATQTPTPSPTTTATATATVTPLPIVVGISPTFVGVAPIAATNLKPGETAVRSLQVLNTGNRAFAYTIDVSGGSGPLWSDPIFGLQLRITRPSTGEVLYAGPLQATGISGRVLLAPSASDQLSFEVTLPANTLNSYQNQSTSVDLRFVATVS